LVTATAGSGNGFFLDNFFSFHLNSGVTISFIVSLKALS
jgi:hypothetical protein